MSATGLVDSRARIARARVGLIDRGNTPFATQHVDQSPAVLGRQSRASVLPPAATPPDRDDRTPRKHLWICGPECSPTFDRPPASAPTQILGHSPPILLISAPTVGSRAKPTHEETACYPSSRAGPSPRGV